MRAYLGIDDIKKLLKMNWNELDKELNKLEKDDLKSIIAYSSGFYQASKRHD